MPEICQAGIFTGLIFRKNFDRTGKMLVKYLMNKSRLFIPESAGEATLNPTHR